MTEDIIQKLVGMVLTIFMLPPLTIVFFASILGMGIAGYFDMKDVLTAFVFVLLFAFICGFIVYDNKWQRATFGGTIALIVVSVIFLVTGLVGGTVSFLLGYWGALGVFVIITLLVGISTMIGWWGMASFFKSEG